MRTTDQIRWTKIDDAVVILDLKTEGYFVLDPVATLMWEAALTGADVVRTISPQFRTTPERVAADYDIFIRRSIAQGFLTTQPPTPTPAANDRAAIRRKSLLTMRAWWNLARSNHALKRHGFARTYIAYSSMPIPNDPADGAERLAEAVAAFARAENFFHMKKAPEDCLPRSLALFRYLRSIGLPVEHRIGVRRFPFGAHAWVEYKGRIVHDHESQVLTYSPLARLAI